MFHRIYFEVEIYLRTIHNGQRGIFKTVTSMSYNQTVAKEEFRTKHKSINKRFKFCYELSCRLLMQM